jgi:Na+-translocating ferredoxin:NAD+ oxidoreductase RNF subunit RnfB
MNIALISVLALGCTGAVSAAILYFTAKKFQVFEDPRIDEVEALLPSANCGGCGFAGCRGFAAACVGADSLDGLLCPVGGAETMKNVSAVLGKTASIAEPTIAVVRCSGSCATRVRTNHYDGAKSCAIAAQLYGGETGCAYGCLGYGDCVGVCAFDAIRINPETLLPEIDEQKCTSCGKCAKSCPKMLIELRKKGVDSHRIFVSCRNKDKGALARKACSVACIGCSKCQKACTFEAIIIENNLAYIDDKRCQLCGTCVAECPTNAIIDYK